ncbi:conserved hypothetical protein [Ricinus communis]|uniref:Uncharacterized protein n=1 Tax=Ricinus communis TaxID=3988 RepID=B9RRN3_RICCO|nr:conserved hypothetical protein [Ricinus communis]
MQSDAVRWVDERWVDESAEVALPTEPCLPVGANWMIGPRTGLSFPHSPFPNI